MEETKPKLEIISDPEDRRLYAPNRKIKAMFDPGTLEFAQKMLDTALAHPNCVGLAAPQVGVNSQVVVARSVRWNRWFILYNPRIVDHSEELIWGREGCLSHPGISLDVARYKWVKLNAFDPYEQKEITINLADDSPNETHPFYPSFCRVIQHEVQHLHGTERHPSSHIITDLMGEFRARELLIDTPGQERLTTAWVRNQELGYKDVQSDG